MLNHNKRSIRFGKDLSKPFVTNEVSNEIISLTNAEENKRAAEISNCKMGLFILSSYCIKQLREWVC